MASRLSLFTTAWGVVALVGLLLLFGWNRNLTKRLAFLKKVTATLKHTMEENAQKTRRSMKQITAVINTVPSPVFYKDRHGVYLGCNEAFARMILGISPKEIIGKALSDMPDKIPAELAKKYHAKDQELMDNPGTQFYEARVQCADGELREFFFSKATMMTPSGDVDGIVGVMMDITQRKKAEQELMESRERFRCLQEASFGGVVIHDRGRIIDCNKTLADITGYTREELLGMDSMKLISPEYRTQVMSRILSGLETPCDAAGLRKEGTTYPIEIKARIMPIHGHMARVAELRDITERKKTEEELKALIEKLDETNRKLRDLSLVDTLTGTYSRDHVTSLLCQELKKAKRNNRPVTIMLADIDGFKQMNSVHGHPFGDHVLQRISRGIKKCVREVDLVGRFGGDEFLMVLPDTDLETGKEVAGRIRSAVQGLSWKEKGFTTTLCIGAAAYRPSEDNDPLKEADRCLSRARARGNNQIES
ncbi:hypothetical protein DSLASN_03720 [Desulfoluna limicola]|uniref:Diguanylate cyclase n=2 Tax=Desulfoluna limicola TaxID=2810562 RepID=A0ABN6EZH3_9BACT|nr:hypothetical protein DSLASN_03720 [Desulfoluna limicola]